MVINRKIGLTLLLIFFHFFAYSQILDPISWSSKTQQIDDNTFELQMIATLEDDWHVYSTTHGEGSGGVGIPTEFVWEANENVKFVDGIEERGELLDVFNELINAKEKYFGNQVIFVQKIQVAQPTELLGEVMFQVCNEEGCLAPDYHSFEFQLNPSKNVDQSSLSGATSPTASVTLDDEMIDEFEKTASDSAQIANLPAPKLSLDSALETEESVEEISSTELNKPTQETRSFLEIFIFGFLGGLAALIMPCIFPMIPLTVSMFTKQSKTRRTGIIKALIYGVSIIVIYVALGLSITLMFGAGALNALATNPWVNIAFFILFFIFALSFFGAFELTLPSKWVNKADKGADKGGLIGIFFMALTLTLVSFSCTGPIIGTLLVESANTGAMLGPATGMFGFSLALALPFTLFAIFPSWLNSLPSSGGWLNTVKVSLGFIELAFALKFLSNADLVWQAHWLEREVFLSIWIGVFFVMGLYLLNVFKMKFDSQTQVIGWPRLMFGIFAFIAVFYMLPGLWGAPLKLLSGLTPPKNYSESPTGFFTTALTSNAQTLPENAHYGPHQIPAFLDIEHAIAYSKEVGKPVMVDFTGDACANCRKVEDNVWSDPRVREKLANEVVLASLYVDRMIELPEEEKVYSEEKGRKLRTIGDKWSAYQIREFASNSQPLYVIVDADLTHYNQPLGPEMNADRYLKWMEEGIQNFHASQE